MAASVLADAGFVVALLSRRDTHHDWAAAQARRWPTPWLTCESALSEAFHLLGDRGAPALEELLRRRALVVSFDLGDQLESVMTILRRYGDVPASLADACLVRMTELYDNATLLTTDSDFRVYRRNGRQVVPCVLP